MKQILIELKGETDNSMTTVEYFNNGQNNDTENQHGNRRPGQHYKPTRPN